MALLMMPGVCLRVGHDPLLPGRVLVPGAGPAADGDDVGLAVAVDVGDLDLIAAGEVVVDDDAIELGARGARAIGTRQAEDGSPQRPQGTKKTSILKLEIVR